MTLSPLVKTIGSLVLAAAGTVISQLHTTHPEYTWTGIALIIIGSIAGIFAPSPTQAKQLTVARDEGINKGISLMKGTEPSTPPTVS
jgi:hypothetical protein